MTVQIFGVKGDAETRKALRYFSERRIQTHFVDLKQRAPAKRELQRFAQKYGAEALVDRESKRFEALGLGVAYLGEDAWLQRMMDEPMILRMPLVRNGNQVTVGYEPDTWSGWAS